MGYEAAAGHIDLGLTGDVMLTRSIRVYREKAFLALRELMCSADAVFANLEGPVRKPDEGTPGITTGTHMTMPPELLGDLAWLGVKLVSCANNHAFDYGEGGLLATIRHLDVAGVAHAGSGSNLARARTPAYLDTARGRIALVATTATFRPWNRAGAQRADISGRPGINAFGFSTVYAVDDAAITELRRIGKALGFEQARARDRKHFYSDRELGGPQATEGGAEGVTLAGQRFIGGNAFAVKTAADPADVADNLRWIAEARRQADWVLVSFHSHEFGGASTLAAESRADLKEPADFSRAFARAAIDAGADVFVGHGSHTLLGIEIYKDRPIFHGLGNFVFMNETVPVFPADAYQRFDLGPDATPADFLDARTNKDKKGHPVDPKYWQSVVATCRFRRQRLVDIRLNPIELGHGRPRPQRGRPLLASGALAGQILGRLQELSRPYGTKILRSDGVGVVRL